MKCLIPHTLEEVRNFPLGEKSQCPDCRPPSIFYEHPSNGRNTNSHDAETTTPRYDQPTYRHLMAYHFISNHTYPKLDGCEKQTDMLLDLKVSKQRYGIKPQTIRNCAIPHAVVGKNEKLAARYTAPMPRLRTATDPFWTPIERQAHKLPRRNNHYT